jgi:hypothetical protein
VQEEQDAGALGLEVRVEDGDRRQGEDHERRSRGDRHGPVGGESVEHDAHHGGGHRDDDHDHDDPDDREVDEVLGPRALGHEHLHPDQARDRAGDDGEHDRDDGRDEGADRIRGHQLAPDRCSAMDAGGLRRPPQESSGRA